MTGIGEHITARVLDPQLEDEGPSILMESAAEAHLAPETMLDQPFVAAVMLDMRQALRKHTIIQNLTAPFAERYGEEGQDLRAAYAEMLQAHAGFRRIVRHAIQTVSADYPGVALEAVRPKQVRSTAAKGVLKLAIGDLSPVIDEHGARVTTRGIDPDELVKIMHARARLPELLPGGVATRQVTGSDQNSIMYRVGRRGHKLAFPFRAGNQVHLGEWLVYDDRDIPWCGKTRPGYEGERYRRLLLTIGSPAVQALERHYKQTVDRWK